MTMFFSSRNSHRDLGFDPTTLKRKLVQGIVIPNTYVKLYRNWIINEGARAITMFFLKIAAVTLALECSNSNLSKILSNLTFLRYKVKIDI